MNDWCAGFPLFFVRAMQAEDREAIHQKINKFRRRAWKFSIFYGVLTYLFCWRAISTADDSSSDFQQLYPLLLGLMILLLIAILAIVADLWLHIRRLTHDLDQGIVKRYGGFPAMSSHIDQSFYRLQRARLAPEHPYAGWWFEVLPSSRYVFQTSQGPVKRWIEVRTADVAETPSFARIAAQWLNPAARKDNQTLMRGERDLSQEEREEVLLQAKTRWKRPLLGAIFWPINLIFILSSVSPEARNNSMIPQLVFSAVAVGALYRFVNGFYDARKLYLDAKTNRVVILQTRISVLVEADSGQVVEEPTESSQERTLEGTLLEVLPHSKWVWTQNGWPAVWRRTKTEVF